LFEEHNYHKQSTSKGKISENVHFIDGSVEQVLIRVRDLVHEGYELITHPLPASLRIMFSPYRSVIIGQKKGSTDLSI